MSEQTEQLDDSDFGIRGIEKSQGYEPLVHAVPDPAPEPAIDADSAIAKHLQRPAPPEPVHRDYFDVQTGEPTPSDQTVEVERAASDISAVREAERLELDRARNEALNRELDDATQTLDALRAAEAPHVELQQPQEQPDYTPALDPEAVQAMDPQYDPELIQALSSPKVRAVLENVNLQVEQAKNQYAQATAQLAQEAVATMGALVPELQGMTPDQARGALALMAKQDPQRVAALGQLMARSQNILAAHQQQQFAEQQRQAQAQAQALEQFKVAEDKKWEAAIARDRSAEQIKALRENALPLVERYYGIDRQQLAAIYSGQQRVDAATFMRSANFQLMLSDALSYRMSREAVGRAVNRPIPNVQRPGMSEGPRGDPGEVSALTSKFNLNPSRELAAKLIAARRNAR